MDAKGTIGNGEGPSAFLVASQPAPFSVVARQTRMPDSNLYAVVTFWTPFGAHDYHFAGGDLAVTLDALRVVANATKAGVELPGGANA